MSSQDPLSPEDRACVQRMAQTVRAAILGADRAAEDEADHVARRVVDRMRAARGGSSIPNSSTSALDTGSKKLLYVDLSEAAERLGTTKQALKKYLARHQRRDGRDTVCALGDDVRAVKVRGQWRVRFPDDEVR